MTLPATPNLLRTFDAVYLLNLPDRTDRLRESFQELQKIDPAARTLVEVVPGVRATEAHGFPSVGAYGCFQAHLGALRLARARGVRSVLILEDDLHLERHLAEHWAVIAPKVLTEPWDLLNVGFHPDFNRPVAGGNTLAGSFPGPQVSAGDALSRTGEALGLAHCYAVAGASLPALIAYLELVLTRPAGHPRGGAMHFDGALYHFFVEHPDRIRLRPACSLVGQRSSRSDIAGARWFDRDLPLVGSTVAALRTLRNRFR